MILINTSRYFGRAKDLPGVKELFSSRKKEEEEENQALAYYKKFMNQGPAYFGDLDEADGTLLEYEQEAEEEGAPGHSITHLSRYADDSSPIDWEEAYTNLKSALGLPANAPIPKILRPNGITAANATLALPNQAKRKAADQDADVEMGDATISKRSKKKAASQTKENAVPGTTPTDVDVNLDPQLEHARAAAAFITFLSPEHLLAPKLPTREEMEGVLLNLRKQALVEEYFGNGADQKD